MLEQDADPRLLHGQHERRDWGWGWFWFWAAAPQASQVPSGQSNELAAVAERWFSMAPAVAAVAVGDVVTRSHLPDAPWRTLCDPSQGIHLQESETSLLPPVCESKAADLFICPGRLCKPQTRGASCLADAGVAGAEAEQG